jgi:Tol biopolymer transport system component
MWMCATFVAAVMVLAPDLSVHARALTALGALQRPASAVLSELVWYDRAGKRLSVVGGAADFGSLELSPDGKRLAVAVLDPSTGAHSLWVYDVARGSRTRLTQDPADENWLIWSSDGRQVIFNSERRGELDLFQGSARAPLAEKVLLAGGSAKWPVSWSSDGRYVLFVTGTPVTGNDVWVLPLFGERKAFALLQTDAMENWAAFSPNGKWIAYTSTESGRPEVYVAPFPARGRKWLVSAGGGFQARWRHDGRELFYLSMDRMLMVADVRADAREFEVNGVASLFALRYPYPPYHAYDVSADGQRILVNTSIVSPGGPTRIAGLFR